MKCTCNYTINPHARWLLHHKINDLYAFSEILCDHRADLRDLEVLSCASTTSNRISLRELKDITLLKCLCDARQPFLTEKQLKELQSILIFTSDNRDIPTFLDLVWEQKNEK